MSTARAAVLEQRVMRVAALVPYALDTCAGQRFRIELWAKHLEPRGIQTTFLPFGSHELNRALALPGHYVDKARAMLECYAGQLWRIVAAEKPDVVFIYREAALLGPPVIEQLRR